MSDKRKLSAEERAQRRAQDRERVKAAAEQLLTSEGWQRWVRVRRLASAGPLAGRVHRHQLRTTDR